MTAAASRRLTFALAVLATLVVAHDIVYLLGYGAERGLALTRTGHPAAWESVVLGVIGLTAVVAAIASRQLWRLGRQAHSVAADPARSTGRMLRPYAEAVLRQWVALGLSAGALFVVQENVERVGIGAPAPGLGVLGSGEYAWAVPVVVLVSLAVAAARGLFGLARVHLMARVASSSAARRRRLIASVRPEDRRIPVARRVGRELLGRAPPFPARP